MPTPPSNFQPSSSRLPSRPSTPHHCHSLRWDEPIAQFRAIPPKEEDYYATFEALPFNVNPEGQEDEIPVPFLQSGRPQLTPPPSTSEPAWLDHIFPAPEGGVDDASMNVDNVPDNKGVSPSCPGALSELDNITLIEIGDSAMSSSPPLSSPQGCYPSHSLGYEALQNMILFANLNPGFSTLLSQVNYLALESIPQAPQPKQAAVTSSQHFQDTVGILVSPNRQTEDPYSPQSAHELSRVPLAALQTNTPTSSTLATPQAQDNTHTHIYSTNQIHPGGQPHAYPAHSIQPKANQDAHTTKPSQSSPPSSPRLAQLNTYTPNHAKTSPSCLGPRPPANSQPHHRAQTSHITVPVQTGLGAYSKDRIAQPPRPTGPGSAPPPPCMIGADASSHLPQSATAFQGAVPSTSARPTPAVHTSVSTSKNPPSQAEFEGSGDDVEMGPPLSESESEEGRIDENKEDQLNHFVDDTLELEEGEIGDGHVGTVPQSHISKYQATQASLVGSSFATERRQAERRERRSEALGLGAIGRRASPDTSHRTGMSPSRPGGGGVRRVRARHVPSIAGHLQRPTAAAAQSSPALGQPTVPKQHYPLTLATVYTWRTELDRLKCLCRSSGVFKNPSQYQSELGNVLRQIQENEENPDLTVEVLKETRLLEILKAFRHCNGGAGPGLRSFKPLVVGICKRWRTRVRMMALARPEAVVVSNAQNNTPVAGLATATMNPSVDVWT